MSQEDYIKQLEEDNACLKRKLDEALLMYDELYNSESNLRERLHHIRPDPMSSVMALYAGVAKEQAYLMGRNKGLKDKVIEDMMKDIYGI